MAHPLATEAFKTNGVDLFVERYGTPINAYNTVKERSKKQSKRASLASTTKWGSHCSSFLSHGRTDLTSPS